ncbi:MAG: class I SAM-dependent methyltransferase [Alistipes indistinctus]
MCLGYCEGSILDVGCGTGLLIELVNITPSKYVGVDPSRGCSRNSC